MLKLKGLSAVATGAALLASTTAVAAAPAANPAAKLSIADPARAGAATAKASRLGAAVPTTTLISIGVLAALVVIVLVATGGNSGSPSSP